MFSVKTGKVIILEPVKAPVNSITLEATTAPVPPSVGAKGVVPVPAID